MTFEELISSISANPFLLVAVLLVIGLSISNGMTDAPNSVATCITTRAIKPKNALILAAVCNALGAFLMSFVSVGVASTIVNMINFGGQYNTSLVALSSGIIGAILWSFAVRKIGFPSSESHALIASITGSAIAVCNNFSRC
jgi:PiT family inorganic phosphate transporter